MFENVLSNGKIGTLKLVNRFVMPAMGTSRCEKDGNAGQELIEWYAARARGGFALIITEFTCVDPKGKAVPRQLMIYSDDFIPSLSALADAVHKEGGKIFVQLQHSGRQTTSLVTGLQPVAASAIPCPVNQEIPRELSVEEAYEVIEKFGDAAVRAKKAGFDGVEVHGAHGYLVAGFLSGYSNKRTDEYGGDIAGRSKFAKDIIKNIKTKCGSSFPLMFRISGEEHIEGGRQINETITIIKSLVEAGADAIHVSTGVYGGKPYSVAPANVPFGYNLPAAEAIRKAVDVPVVAVGRINDASMAEEIIESGIADFVALGRASIADPEFPNKVSENKINEICPCVGCLTRCQGVPGINPRDYGTSCMLNPFSGHESRMKITPAKKPKSVVVVGGGPGGLETAWIAAARGHKVTLLEKTNKLGGQFLWAAVPPNKHELSRAIRYYTEMCKKYMVDIRLGKEADADLILSMNPDEVILATGAVPLAPQISTEGVKVVQAVDVLACRVKVEQNVLIVGGGMVGLETAEYLVSQKRKVTIVEMLDDVGTDLHASIKYFLLRSLKENGVEILTNTKVEKFRQDGAICTNESGTIDLLGFDMIVLAIGSRSYNPLEKELAGKVKSLHVIGDAGKPRRAVEAIDEAAILALEL